MKPTMAKLFAADSTRTIFSFGDKLSKSCGVLCLGVQLKLMLGVTVNILKQMTIHK